MKKVQLRILPLLALLWIPAACNTSGGEDCVLTAHTEAITAGKAPTVTRMETADWKEVNWSAGDKIKVFKTSEIKAKDSQGMDFTLTGAEGTPSGQFTATGSGAYNKANVYAIYPAGLVKGHDGTVVKLELPAEQHYVPNTFSTSSLAAVATGSSKEEMLFTNLCGLLIIKLTSPDDGFCVSSLQLTTGGDESLWGEGTVDVASKETPALKLTAPETDARKTITLVCDTPVQLGHEPTAFCFTLPAGTLTKGFTLSVIDNLYGQMQLTGTSGKTTIGRSTSRTPSLSFRYAATAVNSETTLNGMAIGYSNGAAVVVPTVTGTNNGWKVYWGDGASDPYSLTLTHIYDDPSSAVAVFYNVENAETIQFNGLTGINTVYINNL